MFIVFKLAFLVPLNGLLVHVLGKPEPAGFNKQCPLDGKTFYSWMVRIYDRQVETTVAHGSIISYLAVIAGCSFDDDIFPMDHNRYHVIGQKIANANQLQDISTYCSQTRTVKQIIPHPKCMDPNQGTGPYKIKEVFDFSIFVLNDAFDATGAYTYPTITLPVSPRRFLLEVSYLNVVTEVVCEIPQYQNREDRVPAMQRDPFVKSIPFHSQCINSYCATPSGDTPDEKKEAACKEFFGTRANGTQLCQFPTWETIFPLITKPNKLNWYVGAPFACNGTSYGQVADLKRGSKVFGNPRDFYYVLTYLRIWPWLQAAIVRFGAGWIQPFYVEKLELQTEKFDRPPADKIEDQFLPRRVPHSNPKLPPAIQKIWYRSESPSFRVPRILFCVSIVITQMLCFTV